MKRIEYYRIVAITVATIIATIANADNRTQVGYLIVSQTMKPVQTTVFKASTITQADSVAMSFIPGLKCVEDLFQNSVFVNIETETSRLYIEKKRTIINRKGELKLRKWKVKN
ncbi:MAG: hypothetical protein BWX87_00681 [Bacteroidetes bacterium ADurb.Bin123]|jgi:hypothetical protein|nr:MAG: hypothetical protein BWX87_00681 [Bacteroidetes bacterium ADurb.Bin123]